MLFLLFSQKYNLSILQKYLSEELSSHHRSCDDEGAIAWILVKDILKKFTIQRIDHNFIYRNIVWSFISIEFFVTACDQVPTTQYVKHDLVVSKPGTFL